MKMLQNCRFQTPYHGWGGAALDEPGKRQPSAILRHTALPTHIADPSVVSISKINTTKIERQPQVSTQIYSKHPLLTVRVDNMESSEHMVFKSFIQAKITIRGHSRKQGV